MRHFGSASSYVAAVVVIFSFNPGPSLADDVYLRVSIECPADNSRGELVILDENAVGDRWRLAVVLDGDEARRVAVTFSEKGAAFRDWIVLDRADLQGQPDFPLLLAYEHGARELMRFYCHAAPEQKKLYEDILQHNKQALKN